MESSTHRHENYKSLRHLKTNNVRSFRAGFKDVGLHGNKASRPLTFSMTYHAAPVTKYHKSHATRPPGAQRGYKNRAPGTKKCQISSGPEHLHLIMGNIASKSLIFSPPRSPSMDAQKIHTKNETQCRLRNLLSQDSQDAQDSDEQNL